VKRDAMLIRIDGQVSPVFIGARPGSERRARRHQDTIAPFLAGRTRRSRLPCACSFSMAQDIIRILRKFIAPWKSRGMTWCQSHGTCRFPKPSVGRVRDRIRGIWQRRMYMPPEKY